MKNSDRSDELTHTDAYISAYEYLFIYLFYFMWGLAIQIVLVVSEI